MNVRRAWWAGSALLALAAVAVWAPTPGLAAERVVVGENFTATW